MTEPCQTPNVRHEGEYMIGPDGKVLPLPDGYDDDIIEGAVLEQILKQAGISEEDWEKLA